MAEGHLGPRDSTSWPVTKIFSGFRIALDVKKLALAAAGIFVTWLGWWALSWAFYGTASRPDWKKDYDGQKSWAEFERDRDRWNLLHELAGSPDDDVKKDARDFAKSAAEFDQFEAALESQKRITVNSKLQLLLDKQVVGTLKEPTEKEDRLLLESLSIPLTQIEVVKKPNEQAIVVKGKTFEIVGDLGLQAAKPVAAAPPTPGQLAFVEAYVRQGPMPAGRLRVCPWSENRGENPYLLAKRALHQKGMPSGRDFFSWLVHEQLRVLAEPVLKLFAPVWYLFDSASGGLRNRLFLICIIVWNLAVWGYFGGAICRLAAVQFARNEKVPLSEACGFVKQRCKHFVLAPIFPLVCLGVLTILLAIFGFVTGYTYFFGDVVGALMWPVVILMGLVMAVLVVGLFAWPLMYPTIAVEGSDSFDALSRSYSYLYQAPWHFLGYAATALAYGAALVFFVGLMGSLAVYLGKWGFSEAPWLASKDPANDRTPVYLFQHAPTSFGWRDLLLHDSPWAERNVSVAPAHSSPPQYKLSEKYTEHVGYANSAGSYIVTFWLGLVFLLVVGFGYSYFWTASTILYFLLRKKVDDTDFDEIYLDEDDVPPPPPTLAPTAPPAEKPGTMSLNVVEPPSSLPPPAVG